MSPKVSFIGASFNHEKYALDFINSVLQQTNPDFELIIVDDCSKDNTVQIIETIDDSRIRLIKHNYNQGVNVALNTAFLASKGEYLLFFSTDDAFCREYVETTINCFEQHKDIDAIYYDLQTMDEKGNVRSDLQALYSNKTNDKYKALKNLFYGDNNMMIPGMAIRRKVFEEVLYPLDAGILQCQDMIMHIKIMLNYNIVINKNRLAKYRVPSSLSGISYQNYMTVQRIFLETDTLMDEFLKITDVEIFKKIFGEKLLEFGEPTQETIPYFLARLALSSDDEKRKEWGYKTIMKFIMDKNKFQLLHDAYNFDFAQYINLVSGFSRKNFYKLDKKVKYYRKIIKIMSAVILMLLIIIAQRYIGG